MSHSRYRILLLLLIFARWIPSTATAQSISEAVRELDGTLSEREESAVTHSLVFDTGSILASFQDEMLRVAVLSEPIGVASLCIGDGDRILVLHASAALGSLVYEPGDGAWNRKGEFVWEMREPDMTPETIRMRTDYLARNKWVATTASMGDGGTTEFLIDPGLLPAGEIHLAVGIMPSERPEVILGIPEESAGACADEGLVRGYLSDDPLDFQLRQWLQIGR